MILRLYEIRRQAHFSLDRQYRFPESRRKRENCKGAADTFVPGPRKGSEESSDTRYFTGVRELGPEGNSLCMQSRDAAGHPGREGVPRGRGGVLRSAGIRKNTADGSGNRTCRKGGKPSYGERPRVGGGVLVADHRNGTKENRVQFRDR